MGRKSIKTERRAEIVWALFDCLAERGHESVTVKDIAARAGLPYGVIHYYFDSKDAIFIALAEAFGDRYGAVLDALLQGAADPRTRIDTCLDFLVDQFVFDLRLNRAFYSLIMLSYERPELRRTMQTMLRTYRRYMTDTFVLAGAGTESEHLAAALVAVTEGFALQVSIDPEVFDRDQVRALLARAVADALARISGTVPPAT